MQSGGTKQCFLQLISLEIFLPLDFQSWQSCYTANFYWIIKGNEFDAVGLYMSFQNGDWTINDWTISEFWCNELEFIIKKYVPNKFYHPVFHFQNWVKTQL
jgi:hypothetical protein